ncbi:MAG: hypothetical protein AB7F94_15065 [Nitrospira sp.]
MRILITCVVILMASPAYAAPEVCVDRDEFVAMMARVKSLQAEHQHRGELIKVLKEKDEKMKGLSEKSNEEIKALEELSEAQAKAIEQYGLLEKKLKEEIAMLEESERSSWVKEATIVAASVAVGVMLRNPLAARWAALKMGKFATRTSEAVRP